MMAPRKAAFQRISALDSDDVDLVPLTAAAAGRDSIPRKSSTQQQPSYGLSASKPLLSWTDALVAFTSIACCALATTVIMHNRLAWTLGVTYQLVAVGFLLSIMNLCLEHTALMLFLCCEARGSSTLQNYEAILRGTLLGDHISVIWRMSNLLLRILPIALSVGYKLFIGGTSTNMIGPSSELFSDVFGLYALPGLDWNGPCLMTNATLPFLQATATNVSFYSPAGVPMSDPEFPRFPSAYGFDMLMLDEFSVAMLDAPEPAWLRRAQASLRSGERWNISATVTATISINNDTVDQYRNLQRQEDLEYWASYGAAPDLQWPIAHSQQRTATMASAPVS